MKPGKHQRSKQRRQDLCWKVHDCAQSFILLSYTMIELSWTNMFLLVSSSVRGKQLLCFVHRQGQTREQNIYCTVNFPTKSPLTLSLVALFNLTSYIIVSCYFLEEPSVYELPYYWTPGKKIKEIWPRFLKPLNVLNQFPNRFGTQRSPWTATTPPLRFLLREGWLNTV